jgi:segregation and condensation protein A
MEYQIELETFRGPMDLLLFLVKRNEVDICDIPIARIAEQFAEYLNVINTLDVEWAGDFLVMASTLMEIKSKMLLPRKETEQEEEADPRLQLVKQLMEYKTYRDAAQVLESQAEKHMLRLSRQPVDQPRKTALDKQPIRSVELWDLVSAFGRLLRETASLQTRQIVMDETPIHVHMETIQHQLAGQSPMSFREVFTPPHTRGRLIGLFLAILELVKGRMIVAEQSQPFAEITIRLPAPGELEIPEASEPVAVSERQS